MKHSLLLPVAIAFLVSTFAGGCAKSVNFDTWRAGVEDYVKNHGGGDPAVLRELNADPSHPGYRMFSEDRPSQSTDAVGVLVGNAVVADRPWVVFLVGLIDKQKVHDIRVAALSMRDNKYTWRMSKKDDKALDAYVNHNRGLARRRFPDRKDPPVEYLSFPREEDRFEMSQQGESVGVTHPPSGAKWHVTVTAPATKR
jgi:hypothetical protein